MLLRAFLVLRVHAPTVFGDELGYEKLAQSIGRNGHLALFDRDGLSYSPLYPLVLSPIYALGASAPMAYSLIKVVNAFLLSLSLFPTYGIARFVLPRRSSLLVAGLASVASLMTYSSLTIIENLAYPLCLFAVWATLRALRAPSVRTDAVLLASIVLATAARVQLVVLVPAALTAVALAALLGGKAGERPARALGRAVREHLLFIVPVCGGLAIFGVAALGGDALSSLGRYSVVWRSGFPNAWRVLQLVVQHVAGLEFAVGVVPFAGTLVAAYAFFRLRPRRDSQTVFAAVAIGLVAWLLLEVAFDAALFDAPGGNDIPRIHERFLIYVMPLFLVALFAACRLSESRASARVYFAAAGVSALLPAVIPFHTVINKTINYESLGLHPFSQIAGGTIVAAPHATLKAMWFAATVALLFVYVRHRLRGVVILVLAVFVGVSVIAQQRFEDLGSQGRSLLPAHAGWVDRAGPAGEVVLIGSSSVPSPEWETAYANLSISRVYALCGGHFGPEFGEQSLTIGDGGRLRTPSGNLRARYAVARATLGLRGRVVARNVEGNEVLVAPPNGNVSVYSAAAPRRCE